MTRDLGYSVSTILLLSTLTACAAQAEKQEALTKPSKPTTKSTALVDKNFNSSTESLSRPRTKTVIDEWTQAQITLKLFDKEGLPFTTYFLESDFTAEAGSSGEGNSAWFCSKVAGKKDSSAYVHLFFPANPATVEQIRQSIAGGHGLVSANHWQVTNRTQGSDRWARERIDFPQPAQPQTIMGTVYIGEYQGKAFRVTEHFPADAGDGFPPRASLILKSLQLTN